MKPQARQSSHALSVLECLELCIWLSSFVWCVVKDLKQSLDLKKKTIWDFPTINPVIIVIDVLQTQTQDFMVLRSGVIISGFCSGFWK